MAADLDPRLRDALEELDSYLADNIAPLLVADSIEVLLEYSPDLTAEVLGAWVATQLQAGRADLAVSDLFFHALKKLQILEELRLLPEERFASFLVELAGRLLARCPPGDRERLAASLRFLTESRGPRVTSADRIHRAVGEAAPAKAAAVPAPQLSAEELRSLRRFSLLLEQAVPAGAAAAGGPSRDVVRQLLVSAAAGASNAGELEARVGQLRQAGIGPAVAHDLVTWMAESIPDWVVRQGRSVETYRGGSVEAVRRVVQLAGDRARTSERWKELLRAAALHFNQGAYGRAVTLVDLADRMARDGEVDPRVADMARANGHELFDIAALLQATADPRNRPTLRRLVEFFPAWSARQLLDELYFQPDQKRRRLLLAQIEVWGEDAYHPVFDRLATAIATPSREPNGWWFLRNLVFLLHRLPRPDDADSRQLLELVGPYSALGEHPSFQRESFSLLGSLPDGLGANLLAHRLREIERTLEGTAPPPWELPEMWKLLNALAVALARCGTSGALRALVEHALAGRPRTGEAAARLAELSRIDLSDHPEVVARLLAALQSLLPVKVLGFVVSRNEEILPHVVRALAATHAPAVRRALSEVAGRFPDREFGRLAAEDLAAEPVAQPETAHLPGTSDELHPPIAAGPARAALSGDLEVFGLPGLLQTLQQSEASGRLLVRDSAGGERALFELEAGSLVDCRCGRLTAESAFYQVFENPGPGTFEFVRGKGAAPGQRPRLELLGLLMESMRRYDELQRLRLLIPDRTRLRATDVRPSPPPEERDGELIRELWTRVRTGATALDCEAGAEVDAFRVRTILAHWLEEGALQAAAAPAAAAASP